LVGVASSPILELEITEMATLTEYTKARLMTDALSKLEAEYMASIDPVEKKLAKPVHLANFDLPDHSKAKLYDILMGTDK
jgi:hypothetical protein